MVYRSGTCSTTPSSSYSWLALDALIDVFGAGNVAVELWDHGDPMDSARNQALTDIAVAAGVDLVATNNVHYATPAERPLATALAAVRARRSLAELDGWLPAAANACLRSGNEQARRFARWPGAVERAAELARACAFDLSLVAPLPSSWVLSGHAEGLGSPAVPVWLMAPCHIDGLGGVAAGAVGCVDL